MINLFGLIKFCVFENVLYNGKDYFLEVLGVLIENSFSSAFANIFLFYYEAKQINCSINFFRCIDDIIVFNYDNFESISISIYLKELDLKNTNYISFTPFLDLKINLFNNIWLISVYDKKIELNFKVNNLTNWF